MNKDVALKISIVAGIAFCASAIMGLFFVLSGLFSPVPQSMAPNQIEAISMHDVLVYSTDPKQIRLQDRALIYVQHNQFSELETYLAELSQIAREFVLEQIIHHLLVFEKENPQKMQITNERKAFIQKISQEQPHFLAQSVGEGYAVTFPAFNYAAKAKWILNHWKIKNYEAQKMDFFAEKEWSLSTRLGIGRPCYPLRREAMLNQLPKFSAEQIATLTDLYLQDEQMVWLPDNAILVGLIARTQDLNLYQLLWKRKADLYTLQAIDALAQSPIQDFAIEQMIQAAQNPKLQLQILRRLAVLSPLPSQVSQFFIAQLDQFHQGYRTALMLVDLGLQPWMSEQMNHAPVLAKRNIKSALAVSAAQETSM